MVDFFRDLFHYQFLQFAIAAALLASIASGVVGSLVVIKRSTYIAGAISHSVLGGMGVARFFQVVYGINWLTPIVGAIIASIIAASIIAWSTLFGKERTDSVLSVVWALGMAIGITFIMKTPGYGQDLMSYLFGNILMVSSTDLIFMLIFDIMIICIVSLFYNRILAICFNEEAAIVNGLPVSIYIFLQLIITALTTVLLAQVVGIIMVIALLSIPPAIASQFTKRLSSMIILATFLSMAFSILGIVISYGPELPVGATIIEISGICYLVVLFLKIGSKKRA